MKELFSTLNEKEKRHLRLLILFLLVMVLFLIFFSLGQKRSYFRLRSALEAQEKVLAELRQENEDNKREQERWEEARQDIQSLKKSHFYKKEDGIRQVRQDLQQIFTQAGITAFPIRYNYVDQARERISKVEITFNFAGSYPLLKRFLHIVENLPKFLLLERIDFVKIGADGNRLELRIILAGYYESF